MRGRTSVGEDSMALSKAWMGIREKAADLDSDYRLILDRDSQQTYGNYDTASQEG